jgi:hypothetical protein
LVIGGLVEGCAVDGCVADFFAVVDVEAFGLAPVDFVPAASLLSEAGLEEGDG